MNYTVEQRRMITPATGTVFSLYTITDGDGHDLAMTNGSPGTTVTVTFEDADAAQDVVDALNESLSSRKNKVIGKRKSTGKYEVKTDKGLFEVEVEKTGTDATWKVILPTGEAVTKPFSTKREAMECIADELV